MQGKLAIVVGAGSTEEMHPRNPHQGRYDFDVLVKAWPELGAYQVENPRGELTIDFANPEAVMMLNRALLAHHYGVLHWTVPSGYLCPPIPGRMDYLCYLAELLESEGRGRSRNVRILDIGTGANCIYPILGNRFLGWKFVATDVDGAAVRNARTIVEANEGFSGNIRIVQQKKPGQIFKGVIKPADRFAFTVCNPPFYGTAEEAALANGQKREKLSQSKKNRGMRPSQFRAGGARNFGGVDRELWCEGGEYGFIRRMIEESREYLGQVGWFTTLVSKRESLDSLKRVLKRMDGVEMMTIPMKQGQKVSRILAWRGRG